MKQRIRQLQALIILFVFIMQFLSDSTWITVFAATTHTLQDGDTVTITDISTADITYNVISGGKLIVADGGKVEGGVDLSSVGEMEIQAGGEVSGEINTMRKGSSYAEITVNGAANKIEAGRNSTVTVSGSVSDLQMYDNVTVHLNSANITNLSTNANTPSINVSGTVTLKTLSLYPEVLDSGSDNAKLYVTEAVEFLSNASSPSHTAIEVTESTQIKNTGGAYVDILYNGLKYPIVTVGSATIQGFYKAEAPSQVLLEEEAGYTTPKAVEFTVSNEGLEDIMVEQPFPDNFNVEMGGTAGPVPDYYIVPAGESIIATVIPKTGKTVGEYSETIEMNLLSVRESVTTGINENVGAISCSLNLAVNRKPGAGSVQVSDSYYGGTYDVTPSSSTNGVSNVKIEYKEQGTEDSTYTTTKPKKAGKYEVRATFPQTSVYSEVVTTKEFEIAYLPAPEQPYSVSGTKGEGGYLVDNIKIVPAKGYLIASRLDGNYAKSLTYNDEVKFIYLKKADTGEKTTKIKLDLADTKIDQKAPVIKGATDGSTIYKDNVEITVADENLSEVTVNGEKVKCRDGKAEVTLNSENGSVKYEIIAKDKAGNKKKITITMASSWVDGGVVPNESKVKLVKNQPYTLGSGKWKVEGDTTCYAGGNQFYVKSEGTFEFVRQ
ncbi:MAG: hypothetical protein IJ429_03425 [Lachnospiraceae bacterium]|nr:hypothetical protein [Lachnospiraceae bacterium]